MVLHNRIEPSKGLQDILDGLPAWRRRAFLMWETRGDVRKRLPGRFGRRGTASGARLCGETGVAYEVGNANHRRADFFGAAEASAESDDHDEALRMHLYASWMMAGHMGDVGDSRGHYVTRHDLALEGLVCCVDKLEPGRGQKRPRISDMGDRIILGHYCIGAQYVGSLTEMCPDRPDRQYMREPHLRTSEGRVSAKAVLGGTYGSPGWID